MRRLAFVLVALSATGVARADQSLDEIGRRLRALASSAAELDAGVKAPSGAPTADPELIERRFVQAEIAYGVGRFADAALLLFDIVEKAPRNRSYPEALFYLADSFFQKGDNLSAKKYFERIVVDGGPRAAHYEDALERLLEISLRIHDASDVKDVLARLDALPPGARSDSVPYVRGKYAYFIKQYDEALRFFDAVAPASAYAFQARYFAAVTDIARGDQASATKILHALVQVPTKTPEQAKILELSHLALGRL